MREPITSALLGRVEAYLYGSGSFEIAQQNLFPVHLWFFTALITSILILWTLRKTSDAVCAGCLAVIFLIGYHLRDYPLPHELETAMLATSVIFCGQLFANYYENLRERIPKVPIVVAIALLVVGGYIAAQNTKLDFRTGQFGNGAYALSGCALTLAGLIAICHKLPQLRFIERISDATIWIFPLHIFFTYCVSSAAQRLLPDKTNPILSTWAIPLATTIAAVTTLTAGHAYYHRKKTIALEKQ